jgi:hypothetical protein
MSDIVHYRAGLNDAILEIEAEIMAVDLEYADNRPFRLVARRALQNALLLVKDKLAMDKATS